MQYKIKGGNLPVLEISLDNGEIINCENGGMSWMSDNMKLKTSGDGIGKMFSKALSHEAIFSNTYVAQGGTGMISLCTNFPGSIIAIEITPGNEIIAQKGSYLASTEGVNINIFFQKKAMTGFFGGEGFIMQKFSGSGIVFLEIDGSAIEYELNAGEQIVVDTGYLTMMDSTCNINVETVKGGIKNVVLGGEGLFNTIISGPGRVWLQTLPKNQFVRAISYMLPSNNNS